MSAKVIDLYWSQSVINKSDTGESTLAANCCDQICLMHLLTSTPLFPPVYKCLLKYIKYKNTVYVSSCPVLVHVYINVDKYEKSIHVSSVPHVSVQKEMLIEEKCFKMLLSLFFCLTAEENDEKFGFSCWSVLSPPTLWDPSVSKTQETFLIQNVDCAEIIFCFAKCFRGDGTIKKHHGK